MKLWGTKSRQSKISEYLQSVKKLGHSTYQRLASDEWTNAHRAQSMKICQQIQNDEFLNEWTMEMMRLSQPGDTLLEIGCATGATSLYLAKRGRIVSGLDYSQVMCTKFQKNAEKLGLDIGAICADITKKLPISDNSFDIVWHAGVIEHFSDAEAQLIINENARIARKMVISMAPNANSVAYRIGKEIAERNGTWGAGEENPKYTQKDLFIKAGLHNINEYSIDMDFALAFLPASELKNALADIYHNLPTCDNINQGYLLVTTGEK